jgi:hypothetical protein
MRIAGAGYQEEIKIAVETCALCAFTTPLRARADFPIEPSMRRYTLRALKPDKLPQQQGETSMAAVALQNHASQPDRVQIAGRFFGRMARALDGLVS